ncbi:Barstar (barnase inhibitor) [Actinokineospora alba]|uniref:Barstar (Barnase inhibitor) n=1 Tax=Actinokineospora alba TaxID=504798 RepID=A0A1H0LKM8_9PSEU|nr:barstar (barnase inhibitor) [Actinokineospora alba]SDI98885.1 Barstar (barnase inhibitor) [Actinokineospora alba]SDO68645.1 Barstar (barnase inhibitor) [Actinokineospora alba]
MLVVDGSNFADFGGFAREFSRLLCHYTWRGNLDAFNDILRGGFGTPENGWVLRWLDSEKSRSALGHEATARRLEGLLTTCHPSNRSGIRARIANARRGEGPTLFDEIVEIIRIHGPGGDESEDGVLLELR